MTDPITKGWKVNITNRDLLGRFDELVIGRSRPEGFEFITGWDSGGSFIAQFVPDGVVPPDSARLSVPAGVVQAIAEFVKPGPNSKEVGRLEEALKVERERVDRLIAKWT